MASQTAAASQPPYYPSTLRQWAHRVVSYSSQYNSPSWSANKALGEPTVWPQHEDNREAWASLNKSNNEFIELEYSVAVRPTAINIYETYNPGAVVAIKALDHQGHWDLLWSTNGPVHFTASRIFSPPLQETKIKTTTIRLELDCTAATNWCEIDAVQLVGIQDGAVPVVDDTAFIENLRSLVNHKEYSDVQLLVRSRIVNAHKGLLAARSPYFFRLFQTRTAIVFEVDLPNITYNDFIAILTFIYTNRLPIDCSFLCLVAMCKASPIIELPSLRTASMNRLLEILTCDNVVDVLQLVERDQQFGDLIGACIHFMANHVRNMCDIPAFSSLDQSTIIKVIQESTSILNME